MINIKATLKKLHTTFPHKSLDELFEILDCIVEETPSKWNNDWLNNPITVTYDNKSTSIGTLPASSFITAKTTTNYKSGENSI